MNQGVLAANMHAASTLWPQVAHRGGSARCRFEVALAVGFTGRRGEMDLGIGRGHIICTAKEYADLCCRMRQ